MRYRQHCAQASLETEERRQTKQTTQTEKDNDEQHGHHQIIKTKQNKKQNKAKN